MNAEDLLALYPEAFKSVVNSDIRGELDEETADALRSPKVALHWYNMLVTTKRSIETQLAIFKIEKVQKFGRPGYDTWVEDKLKWKTGALRFKASVEEQIAEAKQYL
jgi:hypothetical protein